MLSVLCKYLGRVTHGIVRGNAHPHFPVFTVFHAVKATQMFVDFPPYHHSDILDTLPLTKTGQPIIKDAGMFVFGIMIKQYLPTFINVSIPAKSSANGWVRGKQTLHFFIEVFTD